MEDNTKLGLVVIAILLVFVLIGTVALSLKLDVMESNANDRVTAMSGVVDYQTEWILYQLRMNQGKMAQVKYLLEVVSGWDVDELIRVSKLVDKRIDKSCKELYISETQVTFEELVLLVGDLARFTGYNRN